MVLKINKPEGSIRIITYGGSTTFCYNLKDKETWPYKLQKKLRNNRPGGQEDQVLNGGAINWSIAHAYQRAKKEIPILKPDYVIIYSGINEYSNFNHFKLENVNLEEEIKKGKFGLFTKSFDQNSWIKRNVILTRLIRLITEPNS